MIKSFPLYRSSIPDFDSPFLCPDLPASNYELEMKRSILFLFLLLFHYHAALAQPCLTFLFSPARLHSLSRHLLTLEKQLLSYAKKYPHFTALICQVTSTSAPHRHDYSQFLVAISFNYYMNGCSVLT